MTDSMFERLNRNTILGLLDQIDEHVYNLNRTRGQDCLEYIDEIENLLEVLRARAWQEIESKA